jgi:hypothetical protein
MKTLRNLIAIACGAAVVSCGGGGTTETDTAAVTFAFRIRGMSSNEEFLFRTESEPFIAKAREQLRLPEAQRNLFPTGPIASGTGGYNLNWGWHFTEATLVEVSIELCDGRPSLVEADLPYWLGTVKRFCPWSGYVHAEIP